MTRTRSTLAAAAAIALAALGLPFASHAETASPRRDPADPFCYGCQQVGLTVAGGFGIAIFGGDDHEVDETRLFGVFPRWTIGVTDPIARDTFYEGNFELGIEPMALFNYDPRTGWAAGGSFLLRYNFLAAESLTPYLEGAGGFSEMQFRLAGQADGFTYPLRVSLGVYKPVSERTALMASVGYFHLSNARRELPNLGINAVLIQIGMVALP